MAMVLCFVWWHSLHPVEYNFGHPDKCERILHKTHLNISIIFNNYYWIHEELYAMAPFVILQGGPIKRKPLLTSLNRIEKPAIKLDFKNQIWVYNKRQNIINWY